MRTILLSLCFSFILHVLFFLGTFFIGYIKTLNYIPIIEGDWQNVESLQNVVAFGSTGSPLFFLFTFIGLSLICGVCLVFYRKINSANEKARS
ncbi:hypothetical protein [Bacillus weihaiensis]|uniref:Uncharacterized protein n=1 Tax=Bacillus weihaiensis TaxID=1547283 RepID=A0A1L3MRF5_9BACI|nr:hypothetical protein [Bacillus weihaiensis]APH04906.1 hypothetical protein A9C19_09175 [Bacillus weihaiensis]